MVYSFGSAGETSFELDSHVALGCEVHSFDPTLDAATQAKLRGSAAFSFHNWGLRSSIDRREPRNPNDFKTLPWIMDQLGHDFVDVLKVDIEVHL